LGGKESTLMKNIRNLITTALATAVAAVVFVGAPASADTETRNPDGSVTTTSTTSSTDEYGDGTTTTTKTTTWPCARGQQQVFVETRVEGPQPGGSTKSFTQSCETTAEDSPRGPEDGRRVAGFWASTGAGEHGSAALPEVAFGVLVDGPAATGEATVTVAGRTYAVTLDEQGDGRVVLPRSFPAGKHLVDIRYAGDERTLPTRSGAGRGPAGGPVCLTVAKADSSLAISLPKSWKKTNRPVATIRVRADGSPTAGHVRVRVGGKSVTAVVRDGFARVRLPTASKGGKTVTLAYTGDRNHEAANAKRAVRLR
jgi:hypothetical protein